MERRLRHASGASPLNSSIPRVPPPAPLTRSCSSNARLYGNSGAAANDFGGGGGGGGDESLRAMERYCETLETDHAELRNAFNEQCSTVGSLAALVQENTFKDTAVQGLEAKLREYEAFMSELHGLVTDGRGLRVRPNPNKSSAAAASKGEASTASSSNAAPSVDAVRQAVQQAQLRHRELVDREKKQTAALTQLQAERAAQANNATATATKLHKKSPTDGDASLALMDTPASTKELVSLRQKVVSLEDRAYKAEREARLLSTQLSQRDDAVKKATAAAEVKATELQSAQETLALHEKLLEDVRGRCLEAERRLARTSGGGADGLMSEEDTTSNSKGARLVSSAVSHLFTGAGYVRAARHTPDADLRAAVTSAVSRAVHVPVANLFKLDLQPSKDGLRLECTVRHSAAIDAEVLEGLLLAYPFAELEPLKEAAACAVESELASVRASLENRVREAAGLQRQVRDLEACVERLNGERSAQDEEVNAVMEATANTVRDLHAALKRAQQANADVTDALAAEQQQLAERDALAKTQQASLDEARRVAGLADVAARAAETKVRQLTADKSALEGKLSRLIATHADEIAAVTREQQSRDAARDVDTSTRLAALEKALREAKSDARAVQTQLDASQQQLHATQATCTELETKLAAVTADVAQAERSLDTALLRKTNLGRRSSSAPQTLVAKARAIALDLARADKEAQEAKAAIDEEKAASQQAQADALAAITKESSHSVASLQKEVVELKTRLRAQEQIAEKAERRLATELAALKDAAASAEASHQSQAKAQQEADAKKCAELQSQLATVEQAAAARREELEMKVIALEGLLETEREQHQAEKRDQDKKKATAATEAGTAASRELQREIRGLKRDKESLTEQVTELETDLSDFARMREELQTSLDMAEKQLRAKKQDFDLLVKQLLRLEETERALKEENDSLRGSLAASPRTEAEMAKDAKPSCVDASGNNSPAVSSGLNAPSRLTPRRGLKSPKAAKGSPTSPATGDRGAPVAVVAQARALKRSTSVKSFTRTASQPIVDASASDAAAPPVPTSRVAVAGVRSTAAATSTQSSVKPEKRFQRSQTATNTTSYANGAATTAASTTTFEAPPRLNDFHRQGSNRGYYTNVQQQQQTPLVANGRTSAEERPSTHRRPSSPAAAASAARGSGSAGSGAGALKRQPSSTETVASSSTGVFKRTPSSFLAAAAGNSASFVRTPSGYRRVQQS